MQNSTPTPYFPDNLKECAAWVAKYGLLAPYGLCQCGCGQPTRISRGYSRTNEPYTKGDFQRFCSGHSLQGHWYDSLKEFFWSFCTPGDPNECWLWQGSLHSSGYGALNFRGRTYIASRVAWEIHNKQPFPKGKIACHQCDNRPCVNPHHIWPGTRQDNNADMVSKLRQVRGERNYTAKLTANQVREIRRLRKAGHTPAELAKQFGVSGSLISNIMAGRIWKHIGD